MAYPFDGLRAQGELNEIVDESTGAGLKEIPQEGVTQRCQNGELGDEFVARQRALLEELARTLLQDLVRVEVEERDRLESNRYAHPSAEDVSADLLLDEVDTALGRRLAHRSRLVERALQKIGEGTYEICDATAEPIPRSRLEAVPEAIYTLEAQKRLERRQ